MSASLTPMEEHFEDKVNDFRKNVTWHIEGQTLTYEDGLTQIERDYLHICPEFIFFAEGLLPELLTAGISDEFIIRVEHEFNIIEEAFDKALAEAKEKGTKTLNVDIPDKDEELRKCILDYYTHPYYDRKDGMNKLFNDLLEIYSIEKCAKDSVSDYLENGYDTMNEIY